MKVDRKTNTISFNDICSSTVATSINQHQKDAMNTILDNQLNSLERGFNMNTFNLQAASNRNQLSSFDLPLG